MARKRFCPGCGKSISNNDEFCNDCKPRKKIEYKKIDFNYCNICKSYLVKNKWKKADNLNEAIIDIVKENSKNKAVKIKPVIPNITIAPGVNVEFDVEAEFDGIEYLIPGKVLVTICSRCSKIGASYFEGILQIRNPKENVTRFVDEMLDQGKSKGIYTADIKKVKGGFDYYISSKKFLRKIGKELSKKFEGEFNESPQIFSRDKQKSKNIYRLNVLFRCY